MKNMALNNSSTTPNPAADAPQPATNLTPEVVIEQLRAMREQMPDLAPITTKQRDVLRRLGRTSEAVLQASLNVIGASDNVSSAVGQPIEDVRGLQDESNRWTAVEDDLRTLLNAVSGANLVRRQRLALLAGQAYTIGAQLARDPAHAVLVPHVREIKRLKKIARRKKPAADVPPPETPAPAPQAPSPAPQAPSPAPQHLLDAPEVTGVK
ncbi:MAG TPA: hypothetical protein VHU44_09025 [Acidobacteriaceae bacterium]|nr:hypothetical protein [Acidobacteriaceae bacterium]